jgi:hypothetical protein
MNAATNDATPYEKTAAAQALSDALNDRSQEGLSLRTIAGRLNYKSAVVVSHMRTGRLPIPVDRAVEIAKAVGLDPAVFLKQVLTQRYPNVDFGAAFANEAAAQAAPIVTPAAARIVAEFGRLASKPLEAMSSEHQSVLREVVSDPHPRRRWLGVSEAMLIEVVRETRPDIARDGINERQRELLARSLATLG